MSHKKMIARVRKFMVFRIVVLSARWIVKLIQNCNSPEDKIWSLAILYDVRAGKRTYVTLKYWSGDLARCSRWCANSSFRLNWPNWSSTYAMESARLFSRSMSSIKLRKPGPPGLFLRGSTSHSHALLMISASKNSWPNLENTLLVHSATSTLLEWNPTLSVLSIEASTLFLFLISFSIS